MQINEHTQELLSTHRKITDKMWDKLFNEIFSNGLLYNKLKKEYYMSSAFAKSLGLSGVGMLLSIAMAEVVGEGVRRGRVSDEEIELDDEIKNMIF